MNRNERERPGRAADSDTPSGTESDERNDLPRRRVVAALGAATAGAGALAGCLDGDEVETDDGAEAIDDDDDETAADDDPLGDLADEVDDDEWDEEAGDCHLDAELTLEPHDVSDTWFPVVPSFPEGWEQFAEEYTGQGGRIEYGDPETEREDPLPGALPYGNALRISQDNSPTGEELASVRLEQEHAEQDGTIELNGEEMPVVHTTANSDGDITEFILSIPSPTADEYFFVTVTANASLACVDEMEELARRFVYAFEENPEFAG